MFLGFFVLFLFSDFLSPCVPVAPFPSEVTAPLPTPQFEWGEETMLAISLHSSFAFVFGSGCVCVLSNSDRFHCGCTQSIRDLVERWGPQSWRMSDGLGLFIASPSPGVDPKQILGASELALSFPTSLPNERKIGFVLFV